VIGGINLENIGQVREAGAKAVAVCSAIIGAEEPGEVSRKFVDQLTD